MGKMKKEVSVQDALRHVAENPVLKTDELIQVSVYELVCRTLFELANKPDANIKGSMRKANAARKIILDRMVGKRRAGSHPATRKEVVIDFKDLTGGELE